MKPRLLIGLVCCLLPCISHAKDEGTILQVVRHLKMSRKDNNPQKEVYIDLGFKDGLREGDRVWIYRVSPAVSELTGDVKELLPIRLAQLEILQSGDFTSVGREVAESRTAELPNIDFPVMMVGDRVRKIESVQ